MNFVEDKIVSGLYVNEHFPEIEIHHLDTARPRYVVAHHGLAVHEAESLFMAIKFAKRYAVKGETNL